ncbi:hypothetical protein [Nocardioides antri]|uniref:Uncharacterized protein n=1 Tax=Nocardioides antri TaxID=2607659 RepID=A0A5B1M7J1_9ACTN|nr:hypothetical protein [Nocardioides antri]KAA1428763.1 hypothetical protein F0U47_00640 [Nocardioides antri]
MADTAEFKDVRGEARTGMDIHDVRLAHTDRALIVKTAHDDVRPTLRSGGSIAVFVDVDPHRRGPEYAFVAGTTRGSDFGLVETDGWRLGDAVRHADTSLSIDYENERVRVRIARSSIGDPDEVRLAVVAQGTRRNGELESDWLRTIRHMTRWVTSG